MNENIVKKFDTSFSVYKSERWSKNFWENRFESWENDTFEFMNKYLDKNKTFIDIGAWIGPMSLYASYHSKKCISFEPDPVASFEFQNNININNLSNIVLEKKAISIHDKINLGASEWGHSVTRIGVADNSFSADCLSIKQILDNFNLNESNISLIKIDIEGHEVELLTDDILKKLNVPMHISFHPGWSSNKDEFFHKILPFLLAKNFDLNNYPHEKSFFELTFE